MQMCLTGEAITAQEAKEWGLVSSVYPPEKVVDEAIKLGEKIGTHSKAVVALCKEAVNSALELSQREGLRFENRLFAASFSLNDRKEGMMAFIEKRKPNFTDS
ncbi:putative enoyl-CoA hydratase, mitochondrial [Halocaridina rubra]|uniref:enoyl-CoA hydratase n=1 Tax=Halocaridina rubra TaxID=373956 RepID=A0AAN8X3M5_HALRR